MKNKIRAFRSGTISVSCFSIQCSMFIFSSSFPFNIRCSLVPPACTCGPIISIVRKSFLKTTAFFSTCQSGLCPFAAFYRQDPGPTFRAGIVKGLVPHCEMAFWILIACIEFPALPGCLLHKHPLATVIGTRDTRACWCDTPDILAFRITGACDKRSELPLLDHHGPAAFLADTCFLHHL